jgi:hypothetical protein
MAMEGGESGHLMKNLLGTVCTLANAVTSLLRSRRRNLIEEPTNRNVEIGQQVRKSEFVFFRQLDGW